jgi:nucleotide-binding universal stress UspA family protein
VVFEVPMALPIDARLPEPQLDRARAALRRAKAVGEEYEGVEVATATVRARRAGQAIVEEARRRGVEAIVLARRSRPGSAAGAARRPRRRAQRGVRRRRDPLRRREGPVPRHPDRAPAEG